MKRIVLTLLALAAPCIAWAQTYVEPPFLAAV